MASLSVRFPGRFCVSCAAVQFWNTDDAELNKKLSRRGKVTFTGRYLAQLRRRRACAIPAGREMGEFSDNASRSEHDNDGVGRSV